MKSLTILIMATVCCSFVAAQSSEQEAFSVGFTPAFSPVTSQQLVDARQAPENWLMFSGTYDSQRYSLLDQVNKNNVGQLELRWIYQIPDLDRAETSPVVVDGIMYITESPSNVVAVDARTGGIYWRYNHPLPDDLRVCCGRNNRGVAILGETLYMSTLDAHLVAIDARTGNLLWATEVAPYQSGYSKTAAPLVVGDKVVTGVAGGEFGIRGFVDAYDAQTGERVWRTHTIPGPGEFGNDTWSGDSWRTGGSPTWITGSYDPELNLVYWTTGNPAPDWNGDVRLGDNLYSNSVLAMDGDSGEIAWHFQFTPHDVWDYDAIQIPILADIEFEGRLRKTLLVANRNAFFYTLDREDGEFLMGKPYSPMTWALGLDETGRPIRAPGKEPTYEGVVVAPFAGGATNWYPPAFNPQTGLFYVSAFDGEHEFFKRDDEYIEGERYVGGGTRLTQPFESFYSAIRAIDPATGEVAWDFPVTPRSTAGVMTTAAGLVFSGSVDGYFFALDATTGERLWNIPLGGRVHAAPISYAVDGQQYVTIAAGNIVSTFGLDN